MAEYRKLGRTSSQRKALLRNQVTNLLYHGKIKTTEAKAKEIRRLAEKLITIAVKEKDNFEEVTVTSKKGGESVEKTIKKDAPSKLNARRKILSVLYPVVEVPADGKKKRANTVTVNMANKLFDEIAPKYADRNGGYTRIVKIGQRRGDGAMEVIIELV
ncbi:MAG: L17 family ribosomal protein [Clostridia bacterium]|nr:L17 family ribosomal protein [Clostridia bacterium]